MCFKIIISENKIDYFSVWSDVFFDIQEVTVVDISVRNLLREPDIDGVILLGIFAHERYGGSPRIGESQILSTQSELGMPPWVITTPPFAGHLKKRQQPDCSIKYEIIRNLKISNEEEIHLIFSEIFDRVKLFNQQNRNSRIETIGFDAKFIKFPRFNLRKEAEAVRDAYRNCLD